MPLHYKGTIIFGSAGTSLTEARPSRHPLYGHQRISVHAPHEGVPRLRRRRPARAFGRVLDGLDVMARVGERVGNEFVYPSKPVTIADCGEISGGYAVSTVVDYSAFISGYSAPVTLQKLLNQLRVAQLKISHMEAAMAKETYAYQSGYVRGNALASLVMARRTLGGT
uniref:Uncharacterized protein n=1 Tax=Brassica campestris TaxID=3711 RepID=M4CT22_BRACM